MSTKDELESRAKKWLEDADWYPFVEVAKNDIDIVQSIKSFAQQEAQRAGEAKVREFAAKIRTGATGHVHPWTVHDIAFREMFPDSDL
jgi:hypothetical protein